MYHLSVQKSGARVMDNLTPYSHLWTLADQPSAYVWTVGGRRKTNAGTVTACTIHTERESDLLVVRRDIQFTNA